MLVRGARNASEYRPERWQMIPSLEETEEKIAQPGIAPHVANGTSKSKRSGLFVWLPSWCSALSLRCDLKAQAQGKSRSGDEAGHSVIIRAGTAYRGDMGVYINALGTVTPISTINVFSQVTVKSLQCIMRRGKSYTRRPAHRH